MWFDKRKTRKHVLLTPPSGLGRDAITTQSSICTGETLIGFLDPHTGRLLQAVVVHNSTDIADFYQSYGYRPPCQD